VEIAVQKGTGAQKAQMMKTKSFFVLFVPFYG
jgi:hypothetical protein